MRSNSMYKNAWTLFVLIVAAWACLATSWDTSQLRYGTLDVISDCVDPVLEERVQVSDGEITDPVGIDYTDFGFPLVRVTGGTVSGTIGMIERACYKTYGDELEDRNWVYSCYDSGKFSCTVVLKKP